MEPTLAWLRLDLKRRWKLLLVMALLVMFATATVMTAVAGARRSATVVDRLLAETQPMSALVLPNSGGFDWGPVRDLPVVEALSTMVLMGVGVDGLDAQESAAAVFIHGDDEIMRTVERPVVLAGRLLDPTRPDEAVITPGFEKAYGKGVGDTVTFTMYAPEVVDAYLEEAGELGEPAGPVVKATIVGVVRSGWFADEVGIAGQIVVSPGLVAAYPDSFYGTGDTVRTNALVRLAGGSESIPALKAGIAEVTGRTDIDVWDWGERTEAIREVTTFEANSLLAFGLVAAVASVFLLGQAVARYSAATSGDLGVLGALGLTPSQATTMAATGPTLATLLGGTLGALAAVMASRWFPIGESAGGEPHPGVDADWVVLGAVMVATVLLVAVVSGWAGSAALATARRPGPGRRSAMASAAGRAGMPVPVVIGTRFALEPGRGAQAVPVRPALLGAVVGVLGIVAVLTFSAGVADATDNPERFGRVYPISAILGQESVDSLPVDEVLTAVAAIPEVSGVNDTRSAVGEVDGHSLPLLSLQPQGEPLDFVVTDGRMPDRNGEVVLGPGSAEALDVAVGDTIDVVGTAGRQELAVVGIGLMPEIAHNFYTTGGLVTVSTYDRLFDGYRFRWGLIGLEPGADIETVLPAVNEAALSVPGVESLEAFPTDPPTELGQLQQARAMPLFLAGFLGLLAMGAIGHALAMAVRRRRRDVAVLRAVGMTRWQSRGAVVTQATVLALVGLAVGIPLGVALGRTIWRYVARVTPLDYVPPTELLIIALAVPTAILVASLLAAWPSQRAASMRLGEALRAE